MHVVQPPGVRRVAADLGRSPKRWPWLGSVVRPPFEVRLLAAELVPERGSRCRPGPAGILPLRPRSSATGTPSPSGSAAGLAAEFGESLTERLRLRELDVAHGVVVPLGYLPRQLTHPAASRRPASTVPGSPRTLPSRSPWSGCLHFDRSSPGRRSGSSGGLPMQEPARGTPAKLDAGNLTFVPRLGAVELAGLFLWVESPGEGIGSTRRQPRDASRTRA